MNLIKESKTDTNPEHVTDITFFNNGDDAGEETFNAPLTDLSRIINQIITIAVNGKLKIYDANNNELTY